MENGRKARSKARCCATNANLAAGLGSAYQLWLSPSSVRLEENRTPIQRILQVKVWQVRKWTQDLRPRARNLPCQWAHGLMSASVARIGGPACQ